MKKRHIVKQFLATMAITACGRIATAKEVTAFADEATCKKCLRAERAEASGHGFRALKVPT